MCVYDTEEMDLILFESVRCVTFSTFRYLIREMHCFTLFATHFHELSGLAQSYPNAVKNLHATWLKPVAFEIHSSHDSACSNASSDLVLLYKVEEGIGDQSFGIHVARVSDFPQSVVHLATWKSLELQSLSSIEDLTCLSHYRSSLFDLAFDLKRTLCSSSFSSSTSSTSNLEALLKVRINELTQLNSSFHKISKA